MRVSIGSGVPASARCSVDFYFSSLVLRSILLHVLPNDLLALALADRHHRRAVPACTDYAMARHHVLVLDELDAAAVCYVHAVVTDEEPPDEEPPKAYDASEPIGYDHPLLFHHTVAEFAIHGISERVASNMWERQWKARGVEGQKEESIRLNRVRALRASVAKREWVVDPALDEKAMETIAEAVEMAGFMRSLDLLDDLRSTFPDVFAEAFSDAPDAITGNFSDLLC
ncbi:hypothetical protein HDU96_000987 [Phlyctochytrium bullatum]|nr:hypothetical protein HDU96_000987 [Phlyctochytrium bullatum]